MASSLPAKLKIKEIVPFANRAAQLEKFRPIVSYWCYYYIVDQILAKGLHTADDECMTYTTTLMDKLEQVKADQAGNDAITDDVAAKAYIEQFALETFQRGDDAIHSNKASKQTIDTFQAAATFFDLLNMSIWAPADPEMAAKSKYAKYHAVRIAKAIKAGEDPNASNPVSQEPAPASPSIELEGVAAGSSYQAATVESDPESIQPFRPTSAAQSTPFAAPSATPLAPTDPFENAASPGQESRTGSVGGGYFPSVPTFTSEAAPPTAPTAGGLDVTGSRNQTMQNFNNVPSAPDMASPADFYNQIQQPPAQAPASIAAPPTIPTSAPIPPVQAVPPGSYRTDDDSMTLAAKHAKWAISALNFEDVNTAVKELRAALQSLGAQ